MTSYPLRLAIVGCGAVVTAFHLPACSLVPEVEVVALIDRNIDHVQSLAQSYGVSSWMDDHRQAIGKVDAALVAVPPSAHASVCSDLLSAGVHVLCEKPLAPAAEDCQRMIAQAETSQVLLATAHSRRFHSNLSYLKALIDNDAFGSIYYIKMEDGFEFSWPTQTGYMFHGATAAGVLLENGIHVIDTLLWLLGPVDNVAYRDDALGGVESNAEIALRFASGAAAEIKISRTANLSNTLEIHGSKGWARCDVYEGQFLELFLPNSTAGRFFGAVTLAANEPQDNQSVMARQLEDFAHSVVERRNPRATAVDGLKAVDLVRQCYAQRASRLLPSNAPLPGVVR